MLKVTTMFEQVKTKLLQAFSDNKYLIEDKTAIGMYERLFENRFNTKYTPFLINEMRKNVRIIADPGLSRLIKAGTLYDSSTGLINLNYGEFIKDSKEPLSGIKDVKQLFTITLKGVLRKKLANNTNVNSTELLEAASELFLEIFKAFIKRDGGYVESTLDLDLEIEAMIILDFVTIVAKKNVAVAKIVATKILGRRFKKEELNEPAIVVIGRLIEEGNVFTEWENALSNLEMFLPKKVNLKKLVTYFIVNVPIVFEGVTDYKYFIGDSYALIVGQGYNAKSFNKRYLNATTNFARSFEKNI